MKGYIYKITNKENGKFYIGSTINIDERKERHFEDLELERHHCLHLQRAYNKYGKDAFDVSYKEFEFDEEKDLRLLEERYINYCWNSGKLYNVSKKGGGGDLISYHPKNKEIRELRSKLMKERYANMSDEERLRRAENIKGEKNPNYGHKWSEELRKKVSDKAKEYWKTHESYMKGKTFEEVFGEEKSKEMRKKISEKASKRIGDKNPFFGKTHSDKTKELIRQKHLGRKNTVSSKKVLYDGVIYESAMDCAKALGISYATVAYRCREHIYGFSYVGENDNLPQREAKKMWTFEECEKLASECKTIKEFREKYPKAYHHAMNKKEDFEKIKNKYFTYMRTYWTLEKVINVAKKYSSFKEFRENEVAAFSSMVRHNWVNKVKEIYVGL